ncbi:MAG: redoxin domain-containing protein, partial [Terriglobales bacterium]
MNHAARCLAVAAIAAAQVGTTAFAQTTKTPKQEDMKVHPIASPAERDPIEGELPSFNDATAWLNSQPLTPTRLRGKVVLVQFWTFTCINWLRTLPYVRAWADKYKSQGRVVIGVHTPEFPFEKDLDNIRKQANDMMVTYPIAVDSNYGVWTAFNNEYWPALYLVDAQGRIRYHHFGE